MSLDRKQMAKGLGKYSPVEHIVAESYKAQEEKINKLNTSNPHGRSWHLSIHASGFPGDDKQYCPRKDVYNFMNLPGGEPFTRFSRAIMDSGLAIEEMITSRLALEGFLISAAPWEDKQTGFVDEENWITGNCDGIVVIDGKLHILEIKTKSQKVIDEMKSGEKGPDEQHLKQLKTYIGFINKLFYTDDNLARLRNAEICEQCGKLLSVNNECPTHGSVTGVFKDYKPPTTGSIYYISRDNPSITKEFEVELDEDHVEKGISNVQIAQEAFKQDKLPDRSPNWEGWSKGPCQYCPAKRNFCKPDFKEGVVDLKASHALQYAQQVDPSYDYDRVKESVIDYWKDKDGEEK